MIITYEKLLQYNAIAGIWLKKDENNINTKLAYAIDRFSKRYNEYIKPYTEIREENNAQVKDAQTDFASEDADKNIIKLIVKDDKGNVTYTEYKYTRENQKLLDKKIAMINKENNIKITELLEKEIEIEPYYASSIPNNLAETEIQIFKGIIIDPDFLNETIYQNGQSEKVIA